MGDPAGIGPEILARTLSLPSLRREARLAAVGDPDVMERAVRRTRVSVRFRPMAPVEFDPKADTGREIPLTKLVIVPASDPCRMIPKREIP